MLYKIAHIIQQHCHFLWMGIEIVNDWLFYIRYRNQLQTLYNTNLKDACLVTDKDALALTRFFASQSPQSFNFFRPHSFDLPSIQQLIHRHSMIMWVTYSPDLHISGYAFLRCFWIGKAYRGYIVDEGHRQQGIGKQLGSALNVTQRILHINTYKSISPDNPASLALAKATCTIIPQETTPIGDVCYQCVINNA